MSKTILPIIKWTGTKRYVAQEIVSKFPDYIDTYYEPFIGSASIVANLLKSNKKWKRIICSDINSDLISLWNLIKTNPNFLLKYYTEKWTELNSYNTESDKSKYFVTQRDLFNQEKKPEQFFFISRTCYSGLVRYNSKGNCNTAFHLNRPGINPSKLSKLLEFWHQLIQPIEFFCTDYKYIIPETKDFCFFDPPYWNVTSSIYYGKISSDDFLNFISNLNCNYAITVDGKNNNDDRTFIMPKYLGLNHEYITMGNSSFRRLKGDTMNIVKESLYKNY